VDLELFMLRLRGNQHNYIEFSLDYAHAGQWEEAIAILSLLANHNWALYPMVHYFLGWYYQHIGNLNKSSAHYKLGGEMSKDYCFPNRLEEVIVLKAAIERNPSDAKANYYLGNFWYANKQYDEALECWESSVKYDTNNAICYRNLSLLYYNKKDKPELAKKHLERAFSLDSKDARLLMELDQLNKKLNVSVDERLHLLENHLDLVMSRDDLYLERLSLYSFKGAFEKALELIQERQFHPWEGGEGKVPFQYVTANLELGKKAIMEERYEEAIEFLTAAQTYPHNLGEGKLFGTQENDLMYWLGYAYAKLGQNGKAIESWETASEGLSNPSAAIFYNDQQPDKIFYQGLALLQLNKHQEAENRFHNLVNYGKEHMEDEVKLDYFAISLPDLLIWEEDLNNRNKIHCNYLLGLGYLGLQKREESISYFKKVLQKDKYNLPANIHYRMAEALFKDDIKI